MVISATSGVSEIVKPAVDAIVLKDPRNVGTLIAAIAELTNNSTRRNQIGVQAAITAEKYSWRQNVSQLEGIFENILLSRNAGASVATIAVSPQLPRHQPHPRIAVVQSISRSASRHGASRLRTRGTILCVTTDLKFTSTANPYARSNGFSTSKDLRN